MIKSKKTDSSSAIESETDWLVYQLCGCRCDAGEGFIEDVFARKSSN